MFTTVDKALAALVMGLLSILNLLFGIDLGLSPETVSAIIAAGKIIPTVVPQDQGPVVRKMVRLSLTADQRVIPCDCAARFLHCLAEQLSEPGLLV